MTATPCLARRIGPLLAAACVMALLGACASDKGGSISLVPAEIGSQTQKSGLFTQPIKWLENRPGCKGECPTMGVDSLIFPGNRRLTDIVDHTLALMTWLDDKSPAPYDDIQQLRDYFWTTAGPRDDIRLIARSRYRNAQLTVVELDAGQYRTGMAHGITGTQFLIWRNDPGVLLTLDDLLLPGARARFDAALREAHANWLAHNEAVGEDPGNFNRMWPFATTNNVALTDAGLVAKYQPYEIAPYSFGKPELFIPYAQLGGILRPEFLPTH